MQEKSLKVLDANKTFFSKISTTISKLLIPTRIGINGMLINMKRNALLKAYNNYIENINILTSTINFQFTLCSFKKDLSIGISSKYKYNEIIENFCTFFSNSNIDVVINVSEVE